MTRHSQLPPDEDEGAVENLLGAVGPRTEAPPEVEAAVRDSVRAEWLGMVDARQRRMRMFAYGLAASGLFALLATFVFVKGIGERNPAATVARVVGTLEVSGDGAGAWRRLVGGESIRPGDVLRTGPDGRAALTAIAGIQVRLDADSLVTFDSVERVALSRGAVYVDAEPSKALHTGFGIATAFGVATHVGTQFEVRSHGRLVEINVREGSVRLRRQAGEELATAGERLRVTDERVERGLVSRHDPSWDWAQQVAPEFSIEGVPLATFLRWAARETGRKLVYLTPHAAAMADEVVLHGSIGALSPELAVPAVLSTTQLTQAHAGDDELVIAPKSSSAVEP